MQMIIEKSSTSKIVELITKEECPNMKSQHRKIRDIKISKHEFECTNKVFMTCLTHRNIKVEKVLEMLVEL